jgi:multiple sugar transport system substrate-binding protein
MKQAISASISRRRRVLKGSAVLVAAALIAPSVTACSPTSGNNATGGSNDKTFTIYWNAGHGYKAYEKVIDDFGKKNHLTINWQKLQWPDLTTKLVANFTAGSVPDLVEEQGAGTGVQYGVQGNVMALDKFIAKDGGKMGFPDDFQAAAVTARQYKGKTYAIPLHLTALGLLFYNKKMLKDAGFSSPPKTWDEFLNVAQKTTKTNVYGFAANSDPAYSAPFFAQAGVTRGDAATGQFLEPPSAANRALQFLQDMIFKYKVSPVPVASTDYSGPQKLFSAGRAAMFVSGPWDLLPVRQASSGIDWGVAPPLTDVTQASTLAGSGLMIPAKSAHPELAWELIQELTTLKVELAVTKEVGMTMPRVSWGKAPQVAGDPVLAAVATTLNVLVQPDPTLPATGKSDQIGNLYKVAYQKIVIQDQPVGPTLEQYRSQAKAALK